MKFYRPLRDTRSRIDGAASSFNTNYRRSARAHPRSRCRTGRDRPRAAARRAVPMPLLNVSPGALPLMGKGKTDPSIYDADVTTLHPISNRDEDDPRLRTRFTTVLRSLGRRGVTTHASTAGRINYCAARKTSPVSDRLTSCNCTLQISLGFDSINFLMDFLAGCCWTFWVVLCKGLYGDRRL